MHRGVQGPGERAGERNLDKAVRHQCELHLEKSLVSYFHFVNSRELVRELLQHFFSANFFFFGSM